MSRFGGTLLVAALLSGCGSGAAVPPRPAGVSAHEALAEAQVVADTWVDDARLRWVEGDGIDPDGQAIPDGGMWAFHYATGTMDLELVVRVSPFQMVSEERRPTLPQGYALGEGTLGPSWIDSGDALAALAGPTMSSLAPFSLLLVPTRPPRWVVRSDAGGRWEVQAETGEVLSR